MSQPPPKPSERYRGPDQPPRSPTPGSAGSSDQVRPSNAQAVPQRIAPTTANQQTVAQPARRRSSAQSRNLPSENPPSSGAGQQPRRRSAGRDHHEAVLIQGRRDSYGKALAAQQQTRQSLSRNRGSVGYPVRPDSGLTRTAASPTPQPPLTSTAPSRTDGLNRQDTTSRPPRSGSISFGLNNNVKTGGGSSTQVSSTSPVFTPAGTKIPLEKLSTAPPQPSNTGATASAKQSGLQGVIPTSGLPPMANARTAGQWPIAAPQMRNIIDSPTAEPDSAIHKTPSRTPQAEQSQAARNWVETSSFSGRNPQPLTSNATATFVTPPSFRPNDGRNPERTGVQAADAKSPQPYTLPRPSQASPTGAPQMLAGQPNVAPKSPEQPRAPATALSDQRPSFAPITIPPRTADNTSVTKTESTIRKPDPVALNPGQTSNQPVMQKIGQQAASGKDEVLGEVFRSAASGQVPRADGFHSAALNPAASGLSAARPQDNGPVPRMMTESPSSPQMRAMSAKLNAEALQPEPLREQRNSMPPVAPNPVISPRASTMPRPAELNQTQATGPHQEPKATPPTSPPISVPYHPPSKPPQLDFLAPKTSTVDAEIIRQDSRQTSPHSQPASLAKQGPPANTTAEVNARATPSTTAKALPLFGFADDVKVENRDKHHPPKSVHTGNESGHGLAESTPVSSHHAQTGAISANMPVPHTKEDQTMQHPVPAQSAIANQGSLVPPWHEAIKDPVSNQLGNSRSHISHAASPTMSSSQVKPDNSVAQPPVSSHMETPERHAVTEGLSGATDFAHPGNVTPSHRPETNARSKASSAGIRAQGSAFDVTSPAQSPPKTVEKVVDRDGGHQGTGQISPSKARDDVTSGVAHRDGEKPAKKSLLDSPPLPLQAPSVAARALADHRERKKSVKHLSVEQEKQKQIEEAQRTLQELKQDLSMDEHQLSTKDLCSRLGVDPAKGLCDADVTARLLRDGPNSVKLTRHQAAPLHWLKWMTVNSSVLLLAGSILSMTLFIVEAKTEPVTPYENLVLGLLLLVTVIVTATLSLRAQSAASSVDQEFKQRQRQLVTVLRSGQKKAIVAADLVVGDVVEINTGDRIPADLRIIESRGLKLDNSALTGEAMPQERSINQTHRDPIETKNLAFYATHAVEGHGVGVVVRTGERTKIGRVVKLTVALDEPDPPLAAELKRFMKTINIVTCTLAAVVFITAVAQGRDVLECFVLLVAIIVASVPAGIIPATTVMLTLASKRLTKLNCLVKNVSTVETLGAVSVICTDKTGTLTQDRLTVSHVWVDDTVLPMDTSEEHDKDVLDQTSPTVQSLLRCAALCNDAVFDADQEDVSVLKRKTSGNATDASLLKFCERQLGSVELLRAAYPRLTEIPFTHDRKCQIAVHEVTSEATNKTEATFHNLVVAKGAPEKIIEQSDKIECNGTVEPLNALHKDKFHKVTHILAELGERVLGFAQIKLPSATFPKGFVFKTEPPNFPLHGFTLLGLISMVDPPRSAVPLSIAICREAGIRIIMVTGDHPSTAEAVARSIGMVQEGNETAEEVAERLHTKKDAVDPSLVKTLIISGQELKSIDNGRLSELLHSFEDVLVVRASPQQKLQIVEALQESGEVVALTGDGVNDAPALKKADVGIAMGFAGSDVSRDAARLVLLDDNFATIVAAIEQGRLISDNLRKSIIYLMTSNITEIVPFLIVLFFNLPSALSAAAILYIDLGTDIVPAIALVYEEPETDIMKRPPRRPSKDHLLNSRSVQVAYLQIGFLQMLAAFFSYYVILAESGFDFLKLPNEWHSPGAVVTDSYGQDWLYVQRQELQMTIHGTFFATIIITQLMNLYICRRRHESFFSRPAASMRSWHINSALIIEITLMVVVLYIPAINTGMELRPPKLRWLAIGILFNIFILIYDELRKWFLRRYPEGFFHRETSY